MSGLGLGLGCMCAGADLVDICLCILVASMGGRYELGDWILLWPFVLCDVFSAMTRGRFALLVNALPRRLPLFFPGDGIDDE